MVFGNGQHGNRVIYLNSTFSIGNNMKKMHFSEWSSGNTVYSIVSCYHLDMNVVSVIYHGRNENACYFSWIHVEFGT